MIIKTAELYQMAGSQEQYPTIDLPEIAFVGRSNVGKSSLMNALLQRKKLAYTGATPGKTRTINFYLVNDNVFFVDLPGYGYAQIGKEQRAIWQKEMQGYIKHREELALVVHLIDSRHAPTALDKQMNDLLVEAEVPFIIAATKRDKISANVWQKNLAQWTKVLKVPKNAIYPVSSTSKDGLDQLRQLLTPAVDGEWKETEGQE